MEFKVGDWVKCNSDSISLLLPNQSSMFKIAFIDQFNNCFGYDSETEYMNSRYLELWQPQPGEWCWFRSISMPKYIQVLAQFKEYSNDESIEKYSIIFNSDDVEDGVVSIYYSVCEPFIGNLPSFIRN